MDELTDPYENVTHFQKVPTYPDDKIESSIMTHIVCRNCFFWNRKNIQSKKELCLKKTSKYNMKLTDENDNHAKCFVEDYPKGD